MHRWWAAAFRRDPNTGQNSGGGGGNNVPQVTSEQVKKILAEVANETDLTRAVSAMTDRHNGNKDKAIEYLTRAGYKARKQRDEALAENQRVAPLVAAKDDVLLRGDDAKNYNAVVAAAKKANLSIADLAQRVEKLPEIEAEVSNLKQEKVANSAAAAHKYNSAALSKAVNDDGKVLFEKTIQVKSKDANGKDQTKNENVWHVRGRDEKDDKGVVLTEYVDKHVFSSAIKAQGQGGASSSVEFPSSHASNDSTSDGGKNLVDESLKKLNARASAPGPLSFAFGGGATPPHSGAQQQQDASR